MRIGKNGVLRSGRGGFPGYGPVSRGRLGRVRRRCWRRALPVRCGIWTGWGRRLGGICVFLKTAEDQSELGLPADERGVISSTGGDRQAGRRRRSYNIRPEIMADPGGRRWGGFIDSAGNWQSGGLAAGADGWRQIGRTTLSDKEEQLLAMAGGRWSEGRVNQIFRQLNDGGLQVGRRSRTKRGQLVELGHSRLFRRFFLHFGPSRAVRQNAFSHVLRGKYESHRKLAGGGR